MLITCSQLYHSRIRFLCFAFRFKNQNPYRNEVPPTPTKKTVGGGDKSEDENLKTQTILFQRTKNVIQQANDLTECKYDVFRGKSSFLGNYQRNHNCK